VATTDSPSVRQKFAHVVSSAALRYLPPVTAALEGVLAAGERVAVELVDGQPGAGGPDVGEVQRHLDDRAHAAHALVVQAGRTSR